MDVITRKGRAAGAAEAWRRQYQEANGCWCEIALGATKPIHDALVALGPNPNPEDVDKTIGNDSWTEVECDECEQKIESVVVFEADDNEVHLCQRCLTEAEFLLEEV